MPRPPAPKVPATSPGPPRALIGGVVVALVAVVAVVVYLLAGGGGGLADEGGDAADPESGSTRSANALPEGGGIVVSDAEGVPQVHLYMDFQCPWCALLEATSGDAILAAAERGDIGLTVTVMSFLDSNLGNDSSTRAANAALCADDAGAFPAYQHAVFAGQPATEGEGWTDEQLVGFAEQVGISGAALETFRGCLDAGTYNSYVADMQERSNRDGISGSPRLHIDGEDISEAEMNLLMQDPDGFATVLAAHQ